MIDKRAGVVMFAATLAALTYIDRVSIVQAEPYITEEFKLTRVLCLQYIVPDRQSTTEGENP